MTAIATDPPAAPAARLLTVADLAGLPDELSGRGSVSYELHQGRLQTMPPPGWGHGRVQLNLCVLLGAAPHLGSGCGETGVVISRDPDTVLAPDGCFVLSRSLPVRLNGSGHLETIPELVVEIRSPRNTWPGLLRKADVFFGAGVVEVWIAEPEDRTITVMRRGQQPRVWAADQELVTDLLPDFKLNVAAAFVGV